ncbi:MAG: hypothetical protein LUQ38_03195 [Methanotrichaceae archaeon]|nr:hypothetical protein [Methanotrichaceae archaeon]
MPNNIMDYVSIAGKDTTYELYLLAEISQGKQVQNINSTFFGGGVAEMLSKLIPLLKTAGGRSQLEYDRGRRAFLHYNQEISQFLAGL